jgi:hypothetical protein
LSIAERNGASFGSLGAPRHGTHNCRSGAADVRGVSCA